MESAGAERREGTHIIPRWGDGMWERVRPDAKDTR